MAKYVFMQSPGILELAVDARRNRGEPLPNPRAYPLDFGVVYEKVREKYQVDKDGKPVGSPITRFPVAIVGDLLSLWIVKNACDFDTARKIMNDPEALEAWVKERARDPISIYGWPKELPNSYRWAEIQIGKKGIVPLPHRPEKPTVEHAVLDHMGYRGFRVFGTVGKDSALSHFQNSMACRQKAAQADETQIGRILGDMGLDGRF